MCVIVGRVTSFSPASYPARRIHGVAARSSVRRPVMKNAATPFAFAALNRSSAGYTTARRLGTRAESAWAIGSQSQGNRR
jgi:hypothetical protein